MEVIETWLLKVDIELAVDELLVYLIGGHCSYGLFSPPGDSIVRAKEVDSLHASICVSAIYRKSAFSWRFGVASGAK